MESSLAGDFEGAPPEEIEFLLGVARQFREATRIQTRLTPEVRVRHLQLITKAAGEAASVPQPFPAPARRRPRRMFFRLAAAMAAAMLFVLPATAALASDALPDEGLYGVKLAIEQLRLQLEADAAGDAHLHLQFAAARLDEIETMRSQGRARGLERALENLDEHLAEASQTLESLGEDGDLEDQLNDVRGHHVEVLNGLIEDAECDPENPGAGSPQCKGLLNALENSSKHLQEGHPGKPANVPSPSSGERPGKSGDANKKDAGSSGGEPDGDPPQDTGQGNGPPEVPSPPYRG